MSSITEYAKQELRAIGYNIPDCSPEGLYQSLQGNDDEINSHMVRSVLELIETFSKQDHSGFSAIECVRLFSTLAKWKPLAPLTGEDCEWALLEYDSDVMYQNKRDARVFKRADGSAYFIEGRVFVEPDGCAYTSKNSRVEIPSFPYYPETVYIKVDANGNPIEV